MPIGRWEGNPHGIPEFEPVFSYTKSELVLQPEAVIKTELQHPIKLTRNELIRNLNSMAGQLAYLQLGISEKRRFATQSRPMPQLTSSREALFFTLESIDQRMLSLLHPLSKRTEQQPLSVLEETFPYYAELSKSSQIKPYIDDGDTRLLRHQLLPEDVRLPVEDIENKLDQCEYQQFGRYKIAFSNIFPIYDQTFGSLPVNSEFIRPWRSGEVLDSLTLSLSAEAESDITPIPEINEND